MEQRLRPRPAGRCGRSGWGGRVGTGPPSLHFLFDNQREGCPGPGSPWDLSETTPRKSCASKGLFFFFSG